MDSKEKLINKARELNSRLNELNVNSKVDLYSLRQYSIKLTAGANGNVLLYYNAKSDSIKPGYTELKNMAFKEVVEQAWNELQEHALPAKDIKMQNSFPAGNISIYTDGSFLNSTVGYGFAVLQGDNKIHEDCGKLEDKGIEQYHQIGGELMAVKEALEYCRKNSLMEVSIYYDYLGVEMWATGKWQAKKKVSKEYVDFIKSANIKINWNKVDSHTGNKWNDYADELAKKASVTNIATDNKAISGKEDLEAILHELGKLLTSKGFPAEVVYKGEYLYFIRQKDKPVNPDWLAEIYLKKGFNISRIGTNRIKDNSIKNIINDFFDESPKLPTADPYFELDYYYKMFSKYRNMNLDLSLLAEKLMAFLEPADKNALLEDSGFDKINYFYNKIKSIQHE